MNAAKRALRYLFGTTSLGIKYEGASTKLQGYCDASWAPPPDRKSITGYLWCIGKTPISWKSSRQRIVALSSCEAEYIAAAEACKDMLWILNLLEELIGTLDTVPLYCDNKSAIATASSTAVKERSKHIDTRYHFIRDLVDDKTVELKYVPTTEMLADALTKKSNNHALERFRASAMVEA